MDKMLNMLQASLKFCGLYFNEYVFSHDIFGLEIIIRIL